MTSTDPTSTTSAPPRDLPPAPGGRAGWFAGLDGIRALAALGVLVTHVGLLSGYVPQDRGWGSEYVARGEVGVAVFFVLSGFLLYRPFVAARLDHRPGPAVRRYVRHRVLRIFPAYWAALTVLGVLLNTRARDDFGSLWEIVMYYGLLQSFSEVTALGGLQQAWTLHNEIMFYLLLPLWAAGAAWVAGRLAPRRALVVEGAVLAVCAAASLGWRLWLHMVYTGDHTVESFDPRFHWLLGNFHMFVPGMALALGLEWSRRREQPLVLLDLMRRHPLVCWALAGVSFWAVSALVLGTQLGAESASQDLGKELLYGSVGIFLVAPVALAGATLPRSLSWLGTRVMVTLGMLSYGIYLWHVGVIDLYLDVFDIATFNAALLPMLAATVVGSVAVAALSYLLVERPALRRKDPKRRPAEPPADDVAAREVAST